MGKAEKTRRYIIEQAAPLFNQKGVAGTSIDDVLNITKVAKGCLYGHFENKEALSHAMVDYLLQKIADTTKTAIEKENTAKKKLFAFLELYKNPLNPVTAGGCPIINFGVESDDTDPVIKQKVKVMIQNSISLFHNIISQGIADQEFSEDFDAAGFSLKMFTLVEGGMMICRVMNSNNQMHLIADMLKKEIETYALH